MESLYGGKSTVAIPKRLAIPEISDKRLLELYSMIKPIVEIDGVKYFLKDFSLEQLRQSYIWDAKDNIKASVENARLIAVSDFLCLHKYLSRAFFKPSVAEVLSQLPLILFGITDAFEIVEQPKDTSDFNKYANVTEAGFHLSKVRAYKIKNQK